MTTVGMAIKVLRRCCRADLPGKSVNAVNTPAGIAIKAAIDAAATEMLTEVWMISHTVASKETRSLIAAVNDAPKNSTVNST